METVEMSPEYEILFGFRPPHPLPKVRKAHIVGDASIRLTDEQVIAYVTKCGTTTSEKMAVDMRLDREDSRRLLIKLSARGDIARDTKDWGPTVYSPQLPGAERPMTARRQVFEAIKGAGEADADKVSALTGLTPLQASDACRQLKAQGLVYVHKKFKRDRNWIPVWRVKTA